MKYQRFYEGDKFIDIISNKTGTVKKLHNNQHEQIIREQDPMHFNYHVQYDDGTVETYLNQNQMIFKSQTLDNYIKKLKDQKIDFIL